MKASVLHEYGGPSKLRYEDVVDPVAGNGEVLVRVAASSVNPIDYKMRSGAAQESFPVEFPAILGRDIAGTVRELGPGVEGFSPGDHVMALGQRAYAELAVVRAADLAHLPEGLDLAESAALPLVTLTGSQLISEGTQIQKGQTVLILGALGGVGRTALMTAKRAGAVAIAGVRERQVGEAKVLGADGVLALDDDDAMSRLGFVDAIADTVGGKTAEILLPKIKQGGVFATVLVPPANAVFNPTIRIKAIHVKPDTALLRALAEDVLHHRLVIPIDRMVSLERAGDAQAAAEKGGIGKILILT